MIKSDYISKLRELIESINEYRWQDAHELTFQLENEIENTLLYEFGEPNKVSDYMTRLRLYISKNIRDDLKSKECRRIISEMMRALSPYGIGAPSSSSYNGNHDIRIDNIIEAYMNRIDRQMLDLASIVTFQTPEFISQRHKIVNSLRVTLTTLKNVVRSYNTDRVEVVSVIEKLVIPEINSCLGELIHVMYDPKKGFGELSTSVKSLKEGLSKLISLIRYPEKTDVILEAIEDVLGIKVSKGKIGEKRKGERKKKKEELEEVNEKTSDQAVQLPTAKLPQFDWVDEEWLLVLQHPRIYVIMGHRGSGKSCCAHSIAEFLHYYYNIKAYFLNVYNRPVPAEKRSLLPDWMEIIDELDDAKNDSVVLVDEAYIKFHARTSVMKALEREGMDTIIELSRQKKISMVFVTQRSTKLDKNILEGTDTFIIRKVHQLQSDYERDFLRKVFHRAFEAFRKIPPSEQIKYCYVFAQTDGYEGLKRIGPPSYWTEELSHFYEGF